MKQDHQHILRSKRLRRSGLYAALGSLLVCVSLAAGCQSQPSEEASASPESEHTQTEALTLPPLTTDDPAGALRTYYEALIKELKAELLREREDRYISDYEYQKRLEALEAALAAYEKATGSLDQPTVAPIETEAATQPEETQPAETQPPLPSATFEYRLENNEIIITAYKGSSVTVMVPAEIAGHPVTAIDDHAFQNTAVTSVVLPGTVRTIGWFAFYGCFGLELVSIPASVTDIHYAAFDGCPNLTLLCPTNSYAAEYAVSFGLKHEYV